MNQPYFLELILYLGLIVLTVRPLGGYIARVYEGNLGFFGKIFRPCEDFFYRFCGIKPDQDMDWKTYTFSMLMVNLGGFIGVYVLLRFQQYLPLNPQELKGLSPDLAFNIAASFVTNTDWQSYTGETTLSYFSQMVALTVQNFLSAATGLSILIALIRGIVRRNTSFLGNFWVDTFRGVFYIFLPLSFVFSLFLVSQGVIQNFSPSLKVSLIAPFSHTPSKTEGISEGKHLTIKEQILPMGPVASQVAIKQWGTNGGGYFGANSAHPFENPTPLTNFLEMLTLVLIPASLCYTFGIMVGDRRQGWALFLSLFLLFVPSIIVTQRAETHPFLPSDIAASSNWEGKETRFGSESSAAWFVATTATGNGAANASYTSFTPLGSLVPLWLIQLGEVVFGGVGSGLYGLLVLVIITVFIAGLMVGRTPSYLGKKIEPFEMKMASLAVLSMPMMVLGATAIALVVEKDTISPFGIHGFTEILYAFSSMGNNNGSAFGDIDVNTPFYNMFGGMVMLAGRYIPAVLILALAGSFAEKKGEASEILSTHTPLFIVLLMGTMVVLAALTFFPALALGPIAEHLMMKGLVS